MPCRWKNRMPSATRPAVDGTASATKPIANCSTATGPYGIGRGHAPTVEIACEKNGTWASSTAAAIMNGDAAASSRPSSSRSTCPSAAISPNATSTNSPADSRVWGDTRRSFAISGSSTPAASAAAARSWSMSSVAAFTSRRRTTPSAGTCRYGSTGASPSAPSSADAAATASSTPREHRRGHQRLGQVDAALVVGHRQAHRCELGQEHPTVHGRGEALLGQLAVHQARRVQATHHVPDRLGRDVSSDRPRPASHPRRAAR